MTELLPCPFCGSAEIYVVPDEVGSGGQWVPPVHVGCKCGVDLVAADADTKAEAVTAWNRRTGERELVEALKQIAEHPGPNADDAAWMRVEIAREALSLAQPYEAEVGEGQDA